MLKSTLAAVVSCVLCGGAWAADEMEKNFANPPDSARPGVYWYFMDGNLNGKEMTADLESMKTAGLGNLVFLEVDLGMPKGPNRWMTEPWQDLFVQIIRDAERLGIDVTLGIGPGWCGSGGPWIKPEQSMQHLVFSSVDLQGPQAYSQKLPLPDQRQEPFLDMRNPFYEDVAVLAFPSTPPVVADINEKALYKREPYSIWKHVKPYLPTAARYAEPGAGRFVAPNDIVDITKQLKPDGTLGWNVPAGNWTVVRLGRRVTGAGTRPAPEAALGLECDKFDAKALVLHLDQYVGKLLQKIGPRAKQHGLTTLHMDSWESGAQNWTPMFLEEFEKRRGYDARPWLLTYTGRAVESLEKSERFLWDLRLTAQELMLENHAGAVKKYGQKHGLSLSIEPYDMNPAGDLDLGAVADVPMAEFWNNSVDSAYSCFESSSIGHVMGRPIVSAEAFTSEGGLDAYPWSLKNQGDWAFCVGINRFVFHTFAHQALGDAYKPGMTFGPYGVHWHRNQTWWPMVGAYHRYLTRCSELLRQGVAVSDVLYLTPEGAPQIFLPPPSALDGSGVLADKKGYGFDGCSPKILMARAEVKDGLIAFPGGTSYRLLVLPQVETMTPGLLAKIRDLVKAGATVVGTPPLKSPSLSVYPACDGEVQSLAKDLWGSMDSPLTATKRTYGKGVVHWGGELSPAPANHRNSISESQWIWYPEGNPAQSAPTGTRYFKRIIHMDEKKALAFATAAVSADNEFSLTINGKKVSEGDNFHVTVTTPIATFLRPGDNVIAVAVANTGGEPNPAGWIGAFDLTYKDGSHEVVKTDSKWSAGIDAQLDWEQAAGKQGEWKDAQVLGGYAMAPWSRGADGEHLRPLYPSYDLTSAILKSMGVVEDFTANGPVRYGHRRTADRDIYFVANRTGGPIKADCRFRVGKGNPQLWDPVTGEMQPLPQFERKEGITTIPMEFDAYQSFFVVFSGRSQESEVSIRNGAKNFPELKPVQDLSGAWDVAFDPEWGGPAEVTFDTLQDWTTCPEPGIKYYSGIATYRKMFNLAQLPGGKTYLDLGVVHDMARVKLNGKDLGVVWCAPWRVEATGAIKTGGNQLEIEVVNRWANRMIGDKQPADANARTVECPPGFLGGQKIQTGRYTFSTHDPYNAQSALVPSGLLGPVVALAQSGSRVVPDSGTAADPRNRPAVKYRLEAKDHGVVYKHGNGPDQCDYLGARDLWIFENKGTFYMHYDGAGPKGWLACLATSTDLVNWTPKGPVLDLGASGTEDSASASYGTTYFDGKTWHIFYLGTPNTSPGPDFIPAPPYLTMKAEGKSAAGPWVKQHNIVPFRPGDVAATNYGASSVVVASPGMIVKNKDEYMMFFSGGGFALDGGMPYGHISIARTKDLNGKWTVDPQPMLSWSETCENSSLYYEPSNKTWFLFTNHINRDHTDAIWVYWTKDLNKWNAEHKAVVLDGRNCKWSKACIGLPSVLKVGNRLAVLYDAPGGDSDSHMNRDIGLAWLELPLRTPEEK